MTAIRTAPALELDRIEVTNHDMKKEALYGSLLSWLNVQFTPAR
jgi:hypothetical protein